MSEDKVEGEDNGITMVDILQEEEELEKDAAAVLGAGDDTHCSYEKGYMKRQPLYACLTCSPPGEDSKPTGVCLACSFHCHEKHNLVELYTKRNFCCDCGNSKLGSNKCKLIHDKSPVNERNKYDHNFKGVYCSCNRPYPDPDMSSDDEMLQCSICEDWYHSMHLEGCTVPEDSNYSEMICHTCAPQLPFLSYYQAFQVMISDENPDVNVEKVEAKADVDNKTSPMKEDTEGKCKKMVNKKGDDLKGALFLADKWRENLCSCNECKEMYQNLKVEYLLDVEDPVSFFEAKGKASIQSTYSVQREIDALSSLDRITRTEVVHEYNNLSVALREYLKKFAENGKVVRGEDIKEFFSDLKSNKKQNTSFGLPYTCK